MRLDRLFLLTIKQMLKKPVILLFIIIMPVLAFSLNTEQNDEEIKITALIYIYNCDDIETDEDYSFTTKDILNELQHYDGLFNFEKIKNEDEFYKLIANGNAECGYIIPSDLDIHIVENDMKKIITVVTSDNTTMAPVINETLFSNIFPYISKTKLRKYLSQEGNSSDYYDVNGELSFNDDDINELYKYYYEEASTFEFEYTNKPADYYIKASDIIATPFRGLLSLLILVSGGAGAFLYYQVSANPVFSNVKVRLVYIGVPVLLCSLSGYISILLSGNSTGFIREMLIMLLFDLIVTLYFFILSTIIKKASAFAGLFPLIIIASIILTPVLIDISLYIPIAKNLSYLWPTAYYLRFF